MNTYDNIVVEIDENVARIALHRPKALNALSLDLKREIREALAELEADERIRCLVLTGSGTAFASGGDLKKLLAELSERDGPRRFRERIQACFDVLYEFPVPTVARVNGPAIGGGLELSVACDLRVASREARFGMPAVRFGMVMACADLVRLAAVVGPGQARRLVLTGEVISAEEAYRIGLLNRLVAHDQLLPTAIELGKLIAGNNARIVQGIKRLLNENVGASWKDMIEAESRGKAADLHDEGVDASFKGFFERKGRE